MKGKSIIVMGVSASGKTTVGQALANALNAKFIDGDDLHPKANIVKMASGMPLNDDDREPWLERINDAVFSIKHKQETGVIVCSALKKNYRDRIRTGNDNLCFVFLDGSEKVIAERIQQREGHFMKAGMIKSQFDALERPDNESDVITLTISASVAELVQQALKQIDDLY
jgi:gluconokinase